VTGLRDEVIHLEWPDVHLTLATGTELAYLKLRAGHSQRCKDRNVTLSRRAAGVLKSPGPDKVSYVFIAATDSGISRRGEPTAQRAARLAKITRRDRAALLPPQL